MKHPTRVAAALLAVALAGTMAACGSSSSDDTASGKVTLNYWLWDDNQTASYQACADAFHTANPNITVKITQTAWAQYWQNLTTQLSAGDAPDVWTDHASYYPQFVTSNQILDIQPYVDPRQGRPDPVPGRPRRPVRQGRQALRPAEGLGHDGAGLQHHAAVRAGHRRGEPGQPDLEPDRRRHPAAGHRQGDRRQERPQRPRPGVRQEQREDLRLPARVGRRIAGPERLGRLRRERRLHASWTRTRGAPTTTSTTRSSPTPSTGTSS